MTLRLLSLLIGLGLALAGCASSSAPAPAGAAAAAPPPPAGTSPADVPTEGPFEVPETAGWNNPGVTPEQHRADLESCYGYAWGQVQHDIRIESDRAALRDDDLGIGYSELNRSMNEFEHKNRRTSLFSECMRSRGYTPD